MDDMDGKVQPSVQIKRVGFKRRYQATARPPSDIMSEGSRASPHNQQSVPEAAVRPQVLRQDASAAPDSPQTADIQTDEATILPYRFRVDDLSPHEIEWFKEKIKIPVSLDVPDTSGGTTLQDFDRQILGIPQSPVGNQNPTNAFGKIDFEGEDTIGVLPSWYVRVAVNTPEELIQEMLEAKFEVMNSASHPLRFHCIDYNTWPSSQELPRYDKSSSSNDDADAVITKLQRDLCSLCKKTAGVILTWSGLGGVNIMHRVLGEMVEESCRTGIHAFNLASIATPPWNAVGLDVKPLLQNTGGKVPLRSSDVHHDPPPLQGDCGDAGDESLPNRRPGLGEEISQYATHFLMLDDELAKNHEVLSSDKEKSNFRHFHYKVIKAMENCEKKKTIKMPVVCVLINGYHDALKMVVFALENKIPVLIVQGSGGYADVIADVYLNAVLENTKDRDETGQVRTRITKRPGGRGKFYLDDSSTKYPLLEKIFDSLDLLTVYVPSLSVQTLDSVVFEALLKHKQKEKFGGLVEVMQSKTPQHCMESSTERGFMDSDQVQMDFFIEALKQNSVDMVKIFLEQINISQKLMHHFHMGRVLRLYSQNSGRRERLMDFRRRFVQLLQKMTVLPLRCVCEGCPSCDVSTNTQSKELELAAQRTCLHPIQELFLWTLHDRHVEMAVVFWKRCEDKIAAALMARKVFRQMAEENSDPVIKWQMEENDRQFQTLVIQTLRSCHNMDKQETELLLTKPCPWWGNLSVLQLAIITENREFMTQTACRNILTHIWHGKCPSDRDMPQRPCQLVNIPSDTRCTRWHRCSPFQQYVASLVMQVLFLLLFSYGLLFDLGQGLTPIFIVLIVFVAAITLEEIRQLVSKHAVLRDSKLETSNTFCTKLQTYLSQGWNWIDVGTVLLFGLGLVVFAPVHTLHVIGRTLLSIDIFFFFMRTFQMLMVFEDLGLMLVMAYKMVKDTTNFMIILLIFVLAYSVASQSLLYPESNFTKFHLFHLPRKAFWQVFGELSLEEIEIREMDSCSFNKSKHSGYDEPHCPTDYGSYIVPFFLGFYVMITNVLLLNLLIARFGVTFNKVHDEACEYQSWHRCQTITEYYNRTSLPPPFNIFQIIYYLLVQGCIKVGRCFRGLCQRCRQERRASCPRNAYEMRAQGTQDTDDDGSNTTSPVSGEQNRLMGPRTKGSVTAWRSASRRSVDIVWTNNLPLQQSLSPGVGQGSDQDSGQVSCQESGQQAGQGSGQQSGQRSGQPRDQQSSDEQVQKVYTVEVLKQTTEANNGQQSHSRPAKFQVVRKEGEEAKQGFTVWDLDPTAEYNISVEESPVTLKETVSSILPEDIKDVMEFEDKQAEWVCCQKDMNMAWLNDLHAQTETLQQEIGRMGAELKENHVTLKDDIRKTETQLGAQLTQLTQNTKSLQGMIKYCKQSKSVFENIDGSLGMLHTSIKKSEKMMEKLCEVKEEKKEAEKKRKEAEDKRKEEEEKRKEEKKKRKEEEEKRKTAEEKRKEEEEKRKTAEEKRKEAEENRKTAEEKRKEEEEKRKTAEEKRKEEEEKRKTAEEKRKEAEENRKTAEEKRKEAEENRKTAEEKRKEEEEKRKTAEEKRKEAEENRKTAEEKRTEAEGKRKTAEEKRKTAEEKNKQTEQELEKLKEQVTQLQLEKERMTAELARAREQEQELQHAVQAAKGEQQELVHSLVQTQERLQQEQQQAIQQFRQFLAQVGQAVGATHLAPEAGDSSGGGQ